MIGGAVELREIQVFLAVADALHFGRAAERVGLTPSRVSQTIRILEARLGGPLFERTSRRVQLTPLGRQLAQSVQPPYEALERALIATREAATGIAGSLRVRVRHWLIGGPHLPEIVKTFEDRYPACSVELIGSPDPTPTPPYVELYENEADITATYLPVADPNVTVGPVLTRQGRVVGVSARHPLAHREHVSYEEVADYVVADTPGVGREMMDTFIPPRTPAGRHLIRRAFRNYMALEMAVTRGEVIDIALEAFADYAHPGMKFIPISDVAPMETAWVWLSTNQSSKIEAFARVTEEVLASYRREAQPAGSGLKPARSRARPLSGPAS
jgi:DNA-binding transcriptional LysR family regulator